MTGRTTRRSFLGAALAAAAAAALWLAGVTGRAARSSAKRFRIPLKPFDPGKLRDPHDLAG